MLKRIISAIVLIIILVPLFIAGGRPFSVAIGVLALLGLKEMIDLRSEKVHTPPGILLFSMGMLLLLIFYGYDEIGSGISYTALSILGIGLLFPTLLKEKEYKTSDAFYLFGVICFLGSAFHDILVLRSQNLYLLCYLVLVPILTDTFAYFVGYFFGKHKVAPTISPNKTIEGCIGGAMIGTVLSSIFYYYIIGPKSWISLLLISFLLSVVGQFGDLLFSKMKRENKVKDFSNLIPGHGGVLDRFDSLIFVILAFVVLRKII